MKQQLEQLLKLAEETTNILREALASMDKPALAATYEEVAEAVKPGWTCNRNGELINWVSPDPYQLPTESAAKQDAAFRQIKNLEAYCAEKFEGERGCTIDIDDAGNLVCYDSVYGVIKVSFKAGQWLIANHPEPFLIFFGVKS